jgi:hypothetical protein
MRFSQPGTLGDSHVASQLANRTSAKDDGERQALISTSVFAPAEPYRVDIPASEE